MKNSFTTQFEKALKENKKADAHRLMTEHTVDKATLINVYESVVPEILNSIDCQENDAACIWLEHQMSAIVRSVVESSYPQVLAYQSRLTPKKHVLIACLKEETHELGAIIGAHLFELYGFKTTYVGANTPLFTLENALVQLKPDYLVLSVTNMYNLFEMHKVITKLRDHFPELPIYGAGRGAFLNQHKLSLEGVISGSKDIEALIAKEGLTCSH